MLITVTLDPRILALTAAADSNNVASQIKSIQNWREIQRKYPWVQLLIPRSATRVLQKIKAYPSPDSVRVALESSNLSHVFSVNDVSTLINEILCCSHLEESICAEDALWSQITVEPTYTGTSSELNDALYRILVLILIDERCRESTGVAVASTALCDMFRVSVDAEVVVPDTLPGFAPSELPKHISGAVAHLTSFEDVLDKLDPLAVWSLADSNSGLKMAIRLKMREILKRNSEYDSWEKSIPKFFVGEEFFASVKRHQAASTNKFASVTQETCAFAILRIKTLVVKPFRVSDNSSEQLIRKSDKAKAFRCQITGDGPGLRLMFWERSGLNIELANIGPKFELKMSEGSVHKAV